MTLRTFVVCGLFVAFTLGLDAQGLSRYRNFELGSPVASIVASTGAAPSDVKIVHARPALMQDLQWRPSRWTSGSVESSTDPVTEILFSFYDNQLFRMVVDYGYDRTEGMTDADMVQAISEVYGTSDKRSPAPVRAVSQVDREAGSLVSRWGNAEQVVALYRTSSYRPSFRLIVTAQALDDLARKATTQALRLDAQEAPAREDARQKKEQEDSRAAAEKARTANKGAFRP